jgi:hypothetical protein
MEHPERIELSTVSLQGNLATLEHSPPKVVVHTLCTSHLPLLRFYMDRIDHPILVLTFVAITVAIVAHLWLFDFVNWITHNWHRDQELHLD